MLNILIVDDEKDVEILTRQRFRHAISQEKYTFFFATSGQKAIECLGQHPIECVVTDVNMPQMNGFELLLYLKKHHPTIVTVVVSAHSDDDSISLAEKSGGHHFIAKPMNYKHLEAIFEDIKS